MRYLILLFIFLNFYSALSSQSYIIDGELRQWHKVTLTFDGPSSYESATPNPFADYRLEATFTNGSRSYKVQGYFAGDGDAAETSDTIGNKWRVHFAPDTIGVWSFTTTFYTGTDAAINGSTSQTGMLHGLTGSFTIVSSDKVGRDHRGRGRLAYVGEHYLQFLGDSSWFYKAGADAPENTFAYEDFDEVPNRGSRRKSWQPHQQDYVAADASGYTWQNGKGTELLGVVNYLADKGVNAFSFLTFSLGGDDENVFPHLLKVPIPTYNTYNDANQWALGVHHDRFDVSRLDQWEHILEYADKKGLYIHFKTQETENDQLMDGGDTGRERKLYYRELVARFGHHLALNWNTGEENTQTTKQERDMAQYLYDVDPYHHNIVMHTYPGQTSRYDSLIGSLSNYTGASIQTSNATYNELYARIDEWVTKSAMAGNKWIVACDEPGNAGIGIDSDPNDIALVRHKVLWGTMMAGGAGVEYYYGYQSGCGDLDCQDHRSRDDKYREASYAIKFVDDYLQQDLINLSPDNTITSITSDYAMTNGTNAVVVYFSIGGSTAINLPDTSLTWYLDWYNPRDGSYNNSNILVTDLIATPDNLDWIALIKAECLPIGTPCDDGNNNTVNDTISLGCICVGELVPCPPAGTTCDDGNPITTNDMEDGNCICTGTFPAGSSMMIESEDAIIGSLWAVVSDLNACGLEYTLPPNIVEYNNPPSNPADRIRFTFNVSVAGNYKVFARIKTTNDADDSFWVRANQGNWQKWNKINFPYTATNYEWSQVGNWTAGDNATPVEFTLVAGINTIDFAYREPGAQLDKIYVTQQDITKINEVQHIGNQIDNSLDYWIGEACPNDTIRFLTSLDGDTIKLNGSSPMVDIPLNIKGNGPNATIISGNGSQRIFENALNNPLSIKELSIINSLESVNGGAFYNLGTLNIENVTFKSNFEGVMPKAFTNHGTVNIGSGVVEVK